MYVLQIESFTTNHFRFAIRSLMQARGGSVVDGDRVVARFERGTVVAGPDATPEERHTILHDG